MKKYRATLKHDNGKVNVITYARSEEDARHKIETFENCPPSAIIKIKEIK
jgi:hypothetical protein